MSPGYCQNYEAQSCHFTTFLACSWHPWGGMQKHIVPAQKLLMASTCCGVRPEPRGVLFRTFCDPAAASLSVRSFALSPRPCASTHVVSLSCCAVSCCAALSPATQGSAQTPLHSQDVFLAVLLRTNCCKGKTKEPNPLLVSAQRNGCLHHA